MGFLKWLLLCSYNLKNYPYLTILFEHIMYIITTLLYNYFIIILRFINVIVLFFDISFNII